MRTAAGVLAAVGLMAGLSSPAMAVSDPYPHVAASYVLAIDDAVVWAHQPELARPPASLAKLPAALVLLRDGWREDAVVEVSAAAAAIEGTQIGLRTGERLRAGDALTAMLLHSANDACLALAEHAAGTAAAFVARMDAVARDLGLRGSRFRTPCGLDAAGQASTASDLLTLARAAMARREIADRVTPLRATITTVGGRRLTFTNTNALVGRLRGAIGVKSGFTSRAGQCVVALAEREGHRVWLVLLDAPNRWWVADGMIEAAFASIARDRVGPATAR